MRSLKDRWKAVPRTGRDGDDDLWKQFRAAQDVFFTARAESDKVRNSEQLANQQKKEELLAEAEKLDPSTDLRGAQNALRKIQERYDAVGHVPRGAMRSLEDRMQAVEQKVRGAADSTRARTAPENPMVASMRAAVTKAEEQLAKAEAAGEKRRIDEAKANLATRQEWLAEAEKSAGRR
jgi:6-phosphofructokinase